jgi:PPP family 3-phenylpropionic acid transporter
VLGISLLVAAAALAAANILLSVLVVVLVQAAALAPITSIDGAGADIEPVEARVLLKVPAFRIVIALAALVYGSHALYDAFAIIGWDNAGLDASIISMLWAEAVAAEVVVFFLVGPWLINRIGVRGAAALAALVTAILIFFSGTLYADYGSAAFLSMAALCVIALPLAGYGLADEAVLSPKEA